MIDRALIFNLRADDAADPLPHLMFGSSLPTTTPEGEPIHYLWKETLKAGDWVYPRTGDPFQVTDDDLQTIVNETKRLWSNGTKTFIPTRHENFDAKTNLGYVVDLKAHKGSLWGNHALIGDEALKLARRNDSSVHVTPWTDAKSNKYKLILRHNAMVPNPVMPGLAPFGAIAAADDQLPGDGENQPLVLELSDSLKRSADMTLLETLRELLGDKTLTDETAVAKIKHLQGTSATTTALARELKCSDDKIVETVKSKLGELATANTKLTDVTGKLTTADAKILSLSDDKDKTLVLSDSALRDRARSVDSEIARLVETGRMEPHEAEEIREVFKPNGKPDGLMLADDPVDATGYRVERMLKGFAKRQSKVGSKTGAQDDTLVLDDATKDKDKKKEPTLAEQASAVVKQYSASRYGTPAKA